MFDERQGGWRHSVTSCAAALRLRHLDGKKKVPSNIQMFPTTHMLGGMGFHSPASWEECSVAVLRAGVPVMALTVSLSSLSKCHSPWGWKPDMPFKFPRRPSRVTPRRFGTHMLSASHRELGSPEGHSPSQVPTKLC